MSTLGRWRAGSPPSPASREPYARTFGLFRVSFPRGEVISKAGIQPE